MSVGSSRSRYARLDDAPLKIGMRCSVRHVGLDVVMRLQLIADSPMGRVLARRALQFAHPHILELHDVLVWPPGLAIIDRPSMGATTLEDLRSAGALLPADVIRVGAQLLDGLSALHGDGLAHGGIDAAQVMVSGVPGGRDIQLIPPVLPLRDSGHAARSDGQALVRVLQEIVASVPRGSLLKLGGAAADAIERLGAPEPCLVELLDAWDAAFEVLDVTRGDEATPTPARARRTWPGGDPRASTYRPPPDRIVGGCIGRRSVIYDIERALGRRRLVTVTGVPGIGKSTVLRRYASSAERVYDVVLFANLSRDGAAMVLDMLKTQPTGVAVLIVLDELAVTPHLAKAIRRCLRSPSVRILTASARPLGVVGEVVIPIPPLDPEPAFAVFSEVAARVAPGALLPPATDALVEQLLPSLDGHPLALVRAAASLRLQSIEDLLTEVVDVTEARVPSCLQPVIEGLSQTLGRESATLRLLAHLAPLHQTFTLAVVEAVSVDKDLEPLHDLMALGLLRRTGDRYALSPLVRWLGRPSGSSRSRLTAYYLQAASTLDPADRAHLLEACECGLDDGATDAVAHAVVAGWSVLAEPPDVAAAQRINRVLRRLEAASSLRPTLASHAALLHSSRAVLKGSDSREGPRD